jgi:hypothetical protein
MQLAMPERPFHTSDIQGQCLSCKSKSTPPRTSIRLDPRATSYDRQASWSKYFGFLDPLSTLVFQEVSQLEESGRAQSPVLAFFLTALLLQLGLSCSLAERSCSLVIPLGQVSDSSEQMVSQPRSYHDGLCCPKGGTFGGLSAYPSGPIPSLTYDNHSAGRPHPRASPPTFSFQLFAAMFSV